MQEKEIETITAMKTSPMMVQWHSCKTLAKNAVLLFRMGDFYEAFYEDAELLAKELDLTLTKRQGIPMSGVPHHTCQTYIDKLLAKGFRVAIAEQMEDPKKAKGLVKREVTKIVTPGTLVDSSLLSEKNANFFACISQVGKRFGLAFLDLSTSIFQTLEADSTEELLNEAHRIKVSEFLCSEKFAQTHPTFCKGIQEELHAPINTQEDWYFDNNTCYHTLTEQLKVLSLDGFGLRGMTAGITAAGALLNYIKEDLLLSLETVQSISTYETSDYMSLDANTLKNLELTESLHDKNRKTTLLHVLDRTHTPMGARLLFHWIRHPLLKLDAICERQDAIADFLQHPSAVECLSQLFDYVRDLERLTIRISSGNASPRDLMALRSSIEVLPEIKTCLLTLKAPRLVCNAEQLIDLNSLFTTLFCALADNPPARLSDGNIFKQGYNQELDELRSLAHDGKSWVANYQERLRNETGIRTLKVNFSKAFGYYIDVSKGQAERMPSYFTRRQTLVNNERFISPELKDYEEKALTAEERMSSVEATLFQELREEVQKYSVHIKAIANAIADCDCLLSLAVVARQNRYIRPLMEENLDLEIREGRHPVVESACFHEAFVPNDTELNGDDQRLLVITGPNMAGKSTYIRQVAILCIMAQMGSFIPAKKARMGLVDKVFTRVGASDDLSRGQSTFMVEMAETANILNNATPRSLVILDEIGRGTSTYDGISIAWAVAEYLLTAEGKTAKTLFATHYWELTKLQEKIPGAVNYNVAVKEYQDHIVFLRKIIRGDTDKSYGIHVARLAGLPPTIIARAKEILKHLEENANRKGTFDQDISGKQRIFATRCKNTDKEFQLLLFEPEKKQQRHPILEKIKTINLDELSPIQAHQLLAKIQNEI